MDYEYLSYAIDYLPTKFKKHAHIGLLTICDGDLYVLDKLNMARLKHDCSRQDKGIISIIRLTPTECTILREACLISLKKQAVKREKKRKEAYSKRHSAFYKAANDLSMIDRAERMAERMGISLEIALEKVGLMG